MYRVLIFLLSLLSLTLLALILGVTLWRDYERNGAVSLSRAFETALNGYSREPELAAKTGSELPALRKRLLYLINTERVRARVPPLTLGVNPGGPTARREYAGPRLPFPLGHQRLDPSDALHPGRWNRAGTAEPGRPGGNLRVRR